MKTNEEISKEYSINLHKQINHKYGDDDYEVHLLDCVNIGKKYIYHIPQKDRDDVLAALYGHDNLEDCKDLCTFEDHVNLMNLRVSMIIKSLTTGEGTRKQRFTFEYYNNIKNTQYSTFVKLCDRISNVKNCVKNNNTKLKMYKKEHTFFKDILYVMGEYEDMWLELNNLIMKKLC